MSRKATHKLFVYGTLRQDQEATHKLACYTMRAGVGNMYDFPFIEYDEDCRGAVLGNVIEVTDKELTQLDIYEGVASGLYVRVKARPVPLGERVGGQEAWVYVGGPALVYPLIQSGDWLAR